MRFTQRPSVELLYKRTVIGFHIDNRDRGDILKQIEKINDLGCEYTIEIRKKKKEPSQSDYIWSLINQIADKKEREPVSVYREMLKKSAERFTIYVNPKGYASFKEEWEGRGQGYQVVKAVDYKDYIKCECIKGLSGMKNAEKTAFIEDLKIECRRLGIEEQDGWMDKTASVYLE